ncbi:MAG: c-type cytochrome [Akkermansiaceae bacterium]|nr:c-type cytochrome [Verrucomicrobiales bacterium]
MAANEAFPPQQELSGEYSGGEATVFETSKNAFALPISRVSEEQRALFFTGNSLFNQNWIAAPASVTTRDGLGPLFVARSCSTCHFKDGRSAPPAHGQRAETMAVRLARAVTEAAANPLPDPIYGSQLQNAAIPGARAEGNAVAFYDEIEGRFADGERFTLRRPRYALTNLNYGPMAAETVVAPLVSPAVIGLGLLEAIPEETLRKLEDPCDRDRDNISGRLNQVWDTVQNRKVPGKFGWKADQPTIEQQTAAAFNGDMGLTTRIFPNENHTAAQPECDRLPHGGTPEVRDDLIAAVVEYLRMLAVPARRDVTNSTVLRGERLFRQLDCAACHVPRLETGAVPDFPALSRQTIRPYTDLLLHDMGAELADGRQVFEAGSREWRTPPLWGIGLVKTVNGHTFLLHDGRARNLTEAILWHGGEAEQSREAFRRLDRKDRDALIQFLESL